MVATISGLSKVFEPVAGSGLAVSGEVSEDTAGVSSSDSEERDEPGTESFGTVVAQVAEVTVGADNVAAVNDVIFPRVDLALTKTTVTASPVGINQPVESVPCVSFPDRQAAMEHGPDCPCSVVVSSEDEQG